MKFHLKHFVAVSAVALAMLGVGGLANNVGHTAHADMPFPEYYHSTKRRDNVYYYVPYMDKHAKYELGQAYLYGRMPKQMKKKNHIFGLYYGKKWYKEHGHDSYFRILHRHGQTYLPDYVGYANHFVPVYVHHKKSEVMAIYINKKDISKPVSNREQNRIETSDSKVPDEFNTVRYLPFKSHHHARRHYARKHYRKARKSVSKWRRSVPSTLRGTWKNRNSEFMFSNYDFNSRYLKAASFAGRYWHPQYKYSGNHTYNVRSGYIKHPAIGNHYKYGKIRLTGKNKAYIYGAGTYRRVSKRLIDNLK